MSRIKKQLEICPPAYMCKGPNRENFVSTGHKCGYCKGNGWFWGDHCYNVKSNYASSAFRSFDVRYAND